MNATAFPAEPGWRLVLFRMGEAGPERMTEPKPIIAWRYPDFYGRPDPITADGPSLTRPARLILVAPVGSATIRDAPSQHPAGPDACVTYATLEAALAAIEAEREEDIPEFGRIFADQPEDSASPAPGRLRSPRAGCAVFHASNAPATSGAASTWKPKPGTGVTRHSGVRDHAQQEGARPQDGAAAPATRIRTSRNSAFAKVGPSS